MGLGRCSLPRRRRRIPPWLRPNGETVQVYLPSERRLFAPIRLTARCDSVNDVVQRLAGTAAAQQPKTPGENDGASVPASSLGHSGGFELLGTLEHIGAATPTSLVLPADMSYERYEALGFALAQAHNRIGWWIADWINFGERVYGEMYAQAIEVTGMRYATLMTYASVARRVPVERRRPELKFGHHAEVASLEPKEQSEWLEQAVVNDWKRDDLRHRLRPPKVLPHAVEAADLEVAARGIVEGARQMGDGFYVTRDSFLRLCYALGDDGG